MTESFSEADLSSIHDRIGRLQASTRRTLPLFLTGILATLVAAGVALYYIVALSGDLKEARASLRQSEAALAAARANLAIANASLHQVQAATSAPSAPSTASTSATSSNARKIAAAISDVSRSQRDLQSASASIRLAAAKLPAEAEEPPVQAQPAGWFAVVGSYTIDAAGLAGAAEQQRRAQAAGICTELWQTRISNNYAVVVGSRSDRRSAGINAERARKAGLAADAFAQPDRGWEKLSQSPDC